MTLQAAVQQRPRQVRDARLQSVEAVVQRQQRVAAERHDHRLLHGCEDGGMNSHRPMRIVGVLLLAPLLHGRRADPVATGKRAHARFTPLDRSTADSVARALPCRIWPIAPPAKHHAPRYHHAVEVSTYRKSTPHSRRITNMMGRQVAQGALFYGFRLWVKFHHAARASIRSAAMSVEPEPPNVSKTRSPGAVTSRMTSANSEIGLLVG